MTMLELIIEPRSALGKKNAVLRKVGKMPAVLYGAHEKAMSVALGRSAFDKVWKEAGESTVIELEGAGERKQALIYDVAVDPVKGTPLHADFYVVEKGQKVQISVPLEFVGESPAVKNFGAALVKVLHEVEVEAAPNNLPHSLDVNISGLTDLEEHSQLLASDIVLPNGVEMITEHDEVVALVNEAVEEVDEVVEAPDMEAIEVEQKGKKEDEVEAKE
jgi:large subunit ribosomal protein L25